MGRRRCPTAPCTGSSPRATGPASTRPRCCSIPGPPRCGSRPVTTARRARRRGSTPTGPAPLAIARPPPAAAAAVIRAGARRLRGPRPGLTKRPRRSARRHVTPALIDQLARLAALGVTVIELLPVHQNDPQEGSYWGYMPLAFGAVHRQYAAGDDPAGELAELVAAAHGHDIEVWLDVVFNHTTEVDATGPDLQPPRAGRRGVLPPATTTARTSRPPGAATTSTPGRRSAQGLVLVALDRFADLGVDGFRFDLAPVAGPATGRSSPGSTSGRPGAASRMIAEPWDAAGTPRARAGLAGRRLDAVERSVPRRRARVPAGRAGAGRDAGSSGCRAAPTCSTRRCRASTSSRATTGSRSTTSSPTTASTTRPTAHRNSDGAGDNRSWNCGWEGDDGVPAEVLGAARRQLRNAWCLLAHVARGADGGDGRRVRPDPGRQQQRLQPGQRDVVGRLGATRRVRRPGAVRRRAAGAAPSHPVLPQAEWWGDAVRWFGANGPADLSHVAVAGLAGRRPVRDGQRVVGAAGVRHPGPRPVAAGRRHRRSRRPTTSCAEGVDVASATTSAPARSSFSNRR